MAVNFSRAYCPNLALLGILARKESLVQADLEVNGGILPNASARKLDNVWLSGL